MLLMMVTIIRVRWDSDSAMYSGSDNLVFNILSFIDIQDCIVIVGYYLNLAIVLPPTNLVYTTNISKLKNKIHENRSTFHRQLKIK